MPKKARYTSTTLEVSKRMIEPGPDFETRAIVHDLDHRLRGIKGDLRYADRSQSAALAAERDKLIKLAFRYIDKLPKASRAHYARLSMDW